MPKRRAITSPLKARPSRQVANDILRLVVCPSCKGPLTGGEESLACGRCPHAYPILDGIPVMLVDIAGAASAAGQSHRQAAFFDEVEDTEFEIERPHGTPWLYRWYYEEKFRRSVSALRSLLPGASVLTVCGGSGMDAEFLARAGCCVIASDVSVGACRRALERARRHGVSLAVVAADAADLPFADRSVDLVYVHDGLHHLERPFSALAEMTRIARRAISITEPARAAATALAVRLGVALEVEEAGNRVVRFTPVELERELRVGGFRVVRSQRYAMYYKHEPGHLIGTLSMPGLRSGIALSIQSFNLLAGAIGNRLTVQAVREA